MPPALSISASCSPGNRANTPLFCIDASAPAKQFCPSMTNGGTSTGEVFRPSAARLFLFYVLLSLPFFICVSVIWKGASLNWTAMLVGAGSIIPSSIIAGGIMNQLFPVRLTTAGIHAHSIWGLPRFIRWQDIQSVRKFNLPFLPWLRLYSTDGSATVWLSMFPSSPAKFKLELQKLAPPGNPVLSELD